LKELASYRKKTVRAATWFAAIFIASFWGMKRFTVREVFESSKAVWGALWARDDASVCRNLYYQRMRRCRRCPLYSKLGACGSPFAERPHLGCYCHMETKAKLPEASCWLDDFSDGSTEFGWKETVKRVLDDDMTAGED
jgi:hypothetical protein